MSATLYQNELTSLSTESKRKHPEIRAAADKALQELKGITVTSEQQLAADLRRRPDFADAFLKACRTSNAKLAISGVNALQRLVISQGLPISKLDAALQAFNACAGLGLDVQLKVLQALPSLVQNYSESLRDDLLGSVLQVCAALQGAKVSTISAVAAATLQQLVAAVFTRVTEEDDRSEEIAASVTVPGEEGDIRVRPAAYDAYRLFRDLVLAAEGRNTQFVQLTTLSKEECLELIASCIEAKPQLVHTHKELSRTIRSSVVALAATCLTDNLSFAITVRCIRLLRLLILRYFDKFQAELEPAISLFTHTMEAESSPTWKRVLVMELLRDMFTEHDLIIKAYMAFDQAPTPKLVIQDVLAAFVRLSAEKPAIIGLGQQSTSPVNPLTNRDLSTEQLVADPVGGMAGMLSSFGVTETNVQGISSSWSIPKTPCYEQLDKAQAPTLPETYIYCLVLDCLTGLSDTLAKVVLPSTMHHKHESAEQEPDPAVSAATNLVESCWPAVLATCSTFMNAALDDGYYRALIKAYQRFAQVAGLLRLETPRDALMTTLGKAAVPPQVLNAVTSDLSRSPVAESARVFSNPKHLLSIESLVSQATSISSDKDRRSSLEQTRPVLTVRNLLCLRALLNLAIALGPTLDNAFAVVVQVLKQADIVLSAAGAHLHNRSNTPQMGEYPTAAQSFSAEVAAVEAAASRLLESTADYSDESFMVVLRAFGSILQQTQYRLNSSIQEEPGSKSSPPPRQRRVSALPGSAYLADTQAKTYQFVLPKLGTLAALNVSRFVTSDVESSGWRYLTDEVVKIAASNASPASARRSATDLLCRLAAECITEVSQHDEREAIQDRSLALLLRVVAGIYEEDGQLTNSDLEVQSHIINTVKIILEQSGDTMLAGWDKITAILSSTFESEQGLATTMVDSQVTVDWTHLSNDFVSLRLGRDAFAVIQLLITDFFSILPTVTTAAIIELLFRVMNQSEDLNLSLTAITAAWNVADLLFSVRDNVSQLPTIKTPADSTRFETQLAHLSQESRLAQWILLLIKLRQIVQHGEREPAKAAFQTLCSIAKNTASELPIETWAIVLRHVLIGALADDAQSSTWEERMLSPVLLGGIAETIAQQIEVVSHLPRFNETWVELDGILDNLLSRKHGETTTAVYQALAVILSQVNGLNQAWHQATSKTAALWCSRPPSGQSSQTSYKAYAELGSQLLRLRKEKLTGHFARELISQLKACVKSSEASTYSADCQSLSTLQAQILRILQDIPHNIEGVATHLLNAAVEFATLHLPRDGEPFRSNKPSFVALGAEAIVWLQQLVLQLDDTDGLKRAIGCLADVIEQKYHFQTEHKDTWLWRRATNAAVSLVSAILLRTKNSAHGVRLGVWREYIRVARNVVHANGLPSYHDEQRSFNDEQDDITASRELMSVLVPQIGGDWMPEEDLNSYMFALFQASIVHPLENAETVTAADPPLRGIATIRRGRVKKVVPSRREDMSYECFAQLIALRSNSESTAEHKRLAKAAGPLLTLRLAIPIRAYIADQPLRGRMPQPLSELEELLYCFDQMEKLWATSGVSGTILPDTESGLHHLYPLLVKANRVAGDRWCGSREVLDPLQRLLESLTL